MFGTLTGNQRTVRSIKWRKKNKVNRMFIKRFSLFRNCRNILIITIMIWRKMQS